MTNLNNSIAFKVNPSNQHIVEQYVEDICDKLIINETYFGNLLSGVNEVFLLMIENQLNTSVIIDYSTDYQYITISFIGVSRETINSFNDNPTNLNQSDFMILVNNLTEKIIIEPEKLSLVFSIGALNDKVYQFRKNKLDNYFRRFNVTKAIGSHDQF